MIWKDVYIPSWDVLLPFEFSTSEEECAVLFGKWHDATLLIYASEKVPNRADDPANNFRIHRSDIKTVTKEMHVVGTVHTHPRGRRAELSADDVLLLKGKNLVGYMYHVPTKQIIYYNERGFIAIWKIGGRRWSTSR